MRTTIAITTASFLTLAIVLTGCSTKDSGAPEASGKTSATTSNSQGPDLPHSGAPAVADPIDAAKWEKNPCAVMTPSKFSTFGLENVDAEPDDAMAGPKCDWYPGGLGKLGATFITATGPSGPPQGLSTVYANNKAYDYELWQELPPIRGHPAVAALENDNRPQGECSVAVGLRDDLAYSVSVTDPEKSFGKDPCAVATKLAKLAVKTMKGGA